MAVIKKGILGGFSGKIGDLVGYHRNGKSVIQSRPEQGTAPNRFNISFFSANRSYLQVMWDRMSIGNQALFDNIRLSYESRYEAFVRYSRLLNGYNSNPHYLLTIYYLKAYFYFPVVLISTDKVNNKVTFSFDAFKSNVQLFGNVPVNVWLYYGITQVKLLAIFSVPVDGGFNSFVSDPLIGSVNYYLRIVPTFSGGAGTPFFDYPTFF